VLGALHHSGSEKNLGYKRFPFFFPFPFLWGIAVFGCEKANFDAEKVANLPTA